MTPDQTEQTMALLRDHQPVPKLAAMAWLRALPDLDFEDTVAKMVDAAESGRITLDDITGDNAPGSKYDEADSVWVAVKSNAIEEIRLAADTPEPNRTPAQRALIDARFDIRNKPENEAQWAFRKAYNHYTDLIDTDPLAAVAAGNPDLSVRMPVVGKELE